MIWRNAVPAILFISICGLVYSQGSKVQRPPIVGVAQIALRTKSLDAARRFYGHDLGFAEPFVLKREGGPAASFKVNDHQYIEVTQELKDDSEDRLIHIAFETPDAKKLRDYLASRGVTVPASVKPDSEGNLSFLVKDPEDHEIGFVQYRSGSMHGRQFGKFIPDTRISERVIHAGFMIQDRAKADAFYKDILGFDEMWHGGKRTPRSTGSICVCPKETTGSSTCSTCITQRRRREV